jgi:hypothetical protein
MLATSPTITSDFVHIEIPLYVTVTVVESGALAVGCDTTTERSVGADPYTAVEPVPTAELSTRLTNAPFVAVATRAPAARATP